MKRVYLLYVVNEMIIYGHLRRYHNLGFKISGACVISPPSTSETLIMKIKVRVNLGFTTIYWLIFFNKLLYGVIQSCKVLIQLANCNFSQSSTKEM